ncbi:sugar nucleotide-binding protein [Lysinimonas soli]|uniref:dTDP-4-dehydrorhamnose reductase n=1 Tax=Lysinimonas soli TaxID=1074233 RepID=A0ABW0NTI2_9MICO
MSATLPSVLVLGGAGMIGLGLMRHLATLGIEVAGTSREPQGAPPELRDRLVRFRLGADDLAEVLAPYGPGDLVVNSLGLIKHHIDDNSAADRRAAIAVNSAFPYALAALAEERGFRVIQIVTDCVFSGTTGGYSEQSHHDAFDVYGHSKSLGEVPSPNVLNLRCSVIGPELDSHVNLLEWVLSHPSGSTFSGYTDHTWNGVTTLAFARIVAGVLLSDEPLAGTVHVVPADHVNKSELSSMILRAYGREGVTVEPRQTGTPVDRTLTTIDPARNERLWRHAGYPTIPRIVEMVSELAEHETSGNTGQVS